MRRAYNKDEGSRQSAERSTTAADLGKQCQAQACEGGGGQHRRLGHPACLLLLHAAPAAAPAADDEARRTRPMQDG